MFNPRFTEFVSRELSAILLCVALTAANQPSEVATVVQIYLGAEDRPEVQLAWIEKVRHALFKATAFCGCPRVINAEMALLNELPLNLKSQLRTEPLNLPTSEHYERGARLFDKIYSEKAQEKTRDLKQASPELWQYVEYGYGTILSDLTYLTEHETQLVVLVNHEVMETVPQFNDHLDAALRIGVPKGDIELAIQIANTVKQH